MFVIRFARWRVMGISQMDSVLTSIQKTEKITRHKINIQFIFVRVIEDEFLPTTEG